MRGEPVLADCSPFRQTGGYHPPADEALKTAERQDSEKRQPQTSLDPPCDPEEEERQGEDHADAAREQPVRPFPPEDGLELIDRHALVDLLILRNALVETEFLLPFLRGERRYDAVDGFPLGDRQAGFGQSRRPSDEHQRRQSEENGGKPAADLPAVALGSADLFEQHLFCCQFGVGHGTSSSVAGNGTVMPALPVRTV